MSKGAYAPSDHYQAPSSMTGYIYDGMGNRIAKGPISTLSCNVLTNGFSLNDKYVYGLDGKQLLQTSGWFYVLHSNFYANGQLLATNDGSNWYYNLNDWVGTKRVIANTDGSISSEWASLPYGDGQTRVNYWGTDDTENHFTGKERDPDSGNDYFGARYFTSNLGRFLSPDWSSKVEPVPYAKLSNPQTLNLYSYVGNNPLTGVDADGHYNNGSNGQPCGWYGFTGGGLASTMTAAQVPCNAPGNGNDWLSADNGEGQEWANDTAEASIEGLAQQDQQQSQSTNQPDSSSGVVTGAAANHQRSLVLGMLARLLPNAKSEDLNAELGQLCEADGGNCTFSMTASLTLSVNSAMHAPAEFGGSTFGPHSRYGLSPSLHHNHGRLHPDHFNGRSIFGFVPHMVVDVAIGELFYGSTSVFSY